MGAHVAGRRRLLALVAVVSAALSGSVAVAGAAHAGTPPLAGGVSIDVGGDGGDGFVADSYGTGGIPDTIPAGKPSVPNFTATVGHPIPAGIWHTSRFTDSAYTVPGLTPGAAYQVRLYFLDWYWIGAGKRAFDVDLDGTRVLTDFDISGTAIRHGADGPAAFGVEQDFPLTVGADGTATVSFTRGSADQPQINAIVITPVR
ncbi:malectin domain-containing carbohydrate-binding protein [Amycolatopsis sp. PS_44_ISF1]|uniref:malectin domain-containing carbohydrate-binding protein n=1 Tax=Amycolatopsis sp. PS_44_ISF1 TaxID=2974917 RepID=UPI0028DDDC09|nr:malectin domain-containing carbohydrate-binding protein [Amycolatopsis sp. PS_44_ISF1]MDT8915239.1 malectin [Amycolatopsis sp. PS_44_ISF1]